MSKLINLSDYSERVKENGYKKYSLTFGKMPDLVEINQSEFEALRDIGCVYYINDVKKTILVII